MKKLFVFIFFLPLMTNCGQTRGEAEHQVSAPRTLMSVKIKVDKSTPQIMYINTNNVRVYDLDQAQLSSGVSTNTPYLEQFMKYDKVTLYDTRGAWAYVEGSARDTKTSQVRPVGGWVASATLTPWQPEVFFNVKDNIFKMAQPITLYNDGLEGQAVDQIAQGDTLRVLKGNGERFFVVSKAGKEGWIDAESIDTTQLVAKGFGYKEELDVVIPVSKILKDSKGRPYQFTIQNEDLLDLDFNSDNLENVLKITHTSSGYIFAQNGIEKKIQEQLHYKLDDKIVTNINGENYLGNRSLILNFFGMVAVIDVFSPIKYLASDLGRLMSPNYKTFIKWMKEAENENYREYVVIKLFTRDINLKKITEIHLNDNMLFGASLMTLHSATNEMKLENGNIIIDMKVLHNGVLVDPGNAPDNPEEAQGVDKEILEKYKLTYKNIQLIISKKELLNTSIDGNEIFSKWLNFVKIFQDPRYTLFSSSSAGSYMDEAIPLINHKLEKIILGDHLSELKKNFFILYQFSSFSEVNSVFLLSFNVSDESQSKTIGGGNLVVNTKGDIIFTDYSNKKREKRFIFGTDENILFFQNGIAPHVQKFQKLNGVSYDY